MAAIDPNRRVPTVTLIELRRAYSNLSQLVTDALVPLRSQGDDVLLRDIRERVRGAMTLQGEHLDILIARLKISPGTEAFREVVEKVKGKVKAVEAIVANHANGGQTVRWLKDNPATSYLFGISNAFAEHPSHAGLREFLGIARALSSFAILIGPALAGGLAYAIYRGSHKSEPPPPSC